MTTMLQINDKIIGLSLFEEKFVCDPVKCRGACCVLGDAGAPLLEEELPVLKNIFPVIRQYLRPESADLIDLHGTHVLDESDDEPVTPLLNEKECAYAVFIDGIARCAIEEAWSDGLIKFRKPLSCHLYPVRVREYDKFTAVNYDRWSTCRPAVSEGNRLNVPVFVFCRESIIRRFGETFYHQMEIAAESFVGK